MKNFQIFKNPYVLVEDFKGKYQPIFKEYTKEPPKLNLNSPLLCCPFSNARRSEKTVKKKVSSKPGYCEICLIKFDSYSSHVKTKNHLVFATDQKNYLQIDKFISEMDKSGFFNIPTSPSNRLAESYARQGVDLDSTESLMRISGDSSSDLDETLEAFDVIMNDLEKERNNK